MSTVIEPNAPQGNPLSAAGRRQKRSAELGLNARKVISKRYSLKDAKGNPIEEWPDVVRRVVGHVSLAETDSQQRDEFYSRMSEIMLRREFVPNTPCLVNAGKPNGQLAACFRARRARLNRRDHEDGHRRRDYPSDGRRHRLYV
jgi:ribonucleoside-diphosphate reductase alpha chain